MLIPYINFCGECREAVEYYAKVFGSEEPYIMTYGEAPKDPDYPMPDEMENMVMHASLSIGGDKIYFSDVPSNMECILGNNISLTVVSKDKEELTGYFNAMEKEGEVVMALGETFWSKWYGALTDKFGIMWQFSLEE